MASRASTPAALTTSPTRQAATPGSATTSKKSSIGNRRTIRSPSPFTSPTKKIEVLGCTIEDVNSFLDIKTKRIAELEKIIQQSEKEDKLRAATRPNVNASRNTTSSSSSRATTPNKGGSDPSIPKRVPRLSRDRQEAMVERLNRAKKEKELPPIGSDPAKIIDAATVDEMVSRLGETDVEIRREHYDALTERLQPPLLGAKGIEELAAEDVDAMSLRLYSSTKGKQIAVDMIRHELLAEHRVAEKLNGCDKALIDGCTQRLYNGSLEKKQSTQQELKKMYLDTTEIPTRKLNAAVMKASAERLSTK